MKNPIEKHDIKRLYKYSEIQTDKLTKTFGWTITSELDISKDMVVSYYSRSKFSSDEDLGWSKNEPTSAALVEDYVKYFKSLTGISPETFQEKLQIMSEEDLRKSLLPKTDEREFHFLTKLSHLLTTKNKIIIYGRGYKIVSGERTENETGDKA